MVVKPESTTPKPFIIYICHMNKPTISEKIEYIKYCIDFYQKRGAGLSNQEPLLFKKKWKKEIIEIGDKIKDLEFELLQLTNPEIFKKLMIF